MPNPQNYTGRDFSMYDAMDDEQLRQILRDDASNTEGEDTDMELMLHIMEVLAKRRKAAQEDISPEAALEEFKNKYTYTDNSLISEERPAKKKTIGFSRWQRWVATIAAMLILVFGSALTAQALGFDLWEIFVKWTQETFHFSSSVQIGDSSEPEKDDATPYAGLLAALQQHGITNNLTPEWIPKGYVEGEVRVIETPMQRQFVAPYTNGDTSIRIRIADYLDDFPMQIEQSDALVEIYLSDGIEYYIFDNEGQLQAAWVNERFECFISGPLSLEEIKTMIDSIEKG